MRQESIVDPTDATNLPYIPSEINEIDAIEEKMEVRTKRKRKRKTQTK